jgi:hypothetical protein
MRGIDRRKHAPVREQRGIVQPFAIPGAHDRLFEALVRRDGLPGRRHRPGSAGHADRAATFDAQRHANPGRSGTG